jgi:SSS family solute:Na+ symporter
MLNSASTLMAMDVYRRYIDPLADDRRLVAFGKLSVVVICGISCLFAWLSFDPRSDGNFFLTLSRNTSYLKPGIVSAFFLGICWKRTHPVSAVAAIIAAPIMSFGIEWIYADFLAGIPWLHAHLGAKLNFLHRVFVVFVICVILQVCISLVYSRRDDTKVSAEDVLRSTGALRRAIILLTLIHAIILSVIFLTGADASALALPAAIGSFSVFMWRYAGQYRRGHQEHRSLLSSDLFYAGLLAGVAAGVLYYFA